MPDPERVLLTADEPRASYASRAVLGVLVVAEYLRTRRAVDRQPLQLVTRLAHDAPPLAPRWHVKLVSRAVDRLLAPRLWVSDTHRSIRCIHRAVVLHRLLVRQGVEATVVVGLPPKAATARAHAWVEVAGAVVGPPPGRRGHREMARFE